jgi:hypothetical protein
MARPNSATALGSSRGWFIARWSLLLLWLKSGGCVMGLRTYLPDRGRAPDCEEYACRPRAPLSDTRSDRATRTVLRLTGFGTM